MSLAVTLALYPSNGPLSQNAIKQHTGTLTRSKMGFPLERKKVYLALHMADGLHKELVRR